MYQSWRRVRGGSAQTGPGFLVPPSAAGTLYGFNFRSTSSYVTDGANEVYVLAADTYPTTRGGLTFGWTNAFNSAADRDSGLDRRLAGIAFVNNGNQGNFRIDLPDGAGTYEVRVALGDGTSAQSYQYLQVQDGSTPKFTVDDSDGTSAANFDDATGVNRSAANWPSSNAAQSVSFSGTTVNVKLGQGGGSGFSTLAHLSVLKTG